MFRAEHLAALAEKVLDCKSEVLYGSIHDNWRRIIQHLMAGRLFIVCCRHWVFK